MYKRQDYAQLSSAIDEVQAATDAPFGVNLRADAPDAARPVSYTHLRAHETVLDLVCRLLLEKKQ